MIARFSQFAGGINKILRVRPRHPGKYFGLVPGYLSGCHPGKCPSTYPGAMASFACPLIKGYLLTPSNDPIILKLGAARLIQRGACPGTGRFSIALKLMDCFVIPFLAMTTWAVASRETSYSMQTRILLQTLPQNCSKIEQPWSFIQIKY